MSVVYLARDRETTELVAMKLLGGANAEHVVARRFAREARTVASLEHPHIARVLRVEEDEGVPIAIVTAYVPGGSLRAALARDGALPIERAVAVLREIASALAYAHERRIVHRDVKPENIMLDADRACTVLSDFGIARSLDADTVLTAAGFSVGTPAYMAPEQIAGLEVDERADVYALGLVGWEMLTGRRPWQGETLYQVLHKQQHEELPALDALRPDIPVYLLRALDGAMQKDPARRWRDAAEFLQHLAPTPVALPAKAAPASDAPAVSTAPVVPAGEPSAEEVIGARRWWPMAATLLTIAGVVTFLAGTRYHRASTPETTTVTPVRSEPMAASVAGVASGTDMKSVPMSVPMSVPSRGTAGTGSRTRPANPSREPVPRTRPPNPSPRAVPVAATGPEMCETSDVADARACVRAAVERHDAALRRAFSALLADIWRNRRDPSAAELALRDEQSAWVEARERNCLAATPEIAGEPWQVRRFNCFALRSAERVGQLRARVHWTRRPNGSRSR